MNRRPKSVEMFYIDNKPDASAIFVARNGRNEILAEYEHRQSSTINAARIAYEKELKDSSYGSKGFWKEWDKNAKRNRI